MYYYIYVYFKVFICHKVPKPQELMWFNWSHYLLKIILGNREFLGPFEYVWGILWLRIRNNYLRSPYLSQCHNGIVVKENLPEFCGFEWESWMYHIIYRNLVFDLSTLNYRIHRLCRKRNIVTGLNGTTSVRFERWDI